MSRPPVLTLLLALSLATLFATSAWADDDKRFRCPGTNAAFFEEVYENGWVGYGETWDLSHCDEGLEVYLPSKADRRWKAFRRRPRAPIDEADVRFYSTVFPIGAFGSLGGIFAIAWGLGVLQRRRKVRTAEVACTECEMKMTVPEDDTRSLSLFCPKCGAACQVES